MWEMYTKNCERLPKSVTSFQVACEGTIDVVCMSIENSFATDSAYRLCRNLGKRFGMIGKNSLSNAAL